MTKLPVAKCPKCGKIANGKTEIESLFGIRYDKGRFKIQSWCKNCRRK